VKPFRLGLTGSIGMGKSTTSGLFSEAGVPVWDADAAVHRIYAAGGAGAAVLETLVPDAVTVDRSVDRARLREAMVADPRLLPEIEQRIHPLVSIDRQRFLAANAGSDIVLLDIPLLYETGAVAEVDAVLVVSAGPEIQRERVLSRPGMTLEALTRILSRQLPDADKRARADHLILTDRGLEAARADVLSLLARIRSELRDARDRS
jgi:dephospho-CoA kinase